MKKMILQCLYIGVILRFVLSQQPECNKKEKSFIVLDVVEDFISRAKNLLPKCDNEISDSTSWSCENRDKSSSYLDAAKYLISESKKAYATNFERQREREGSVDPSVNTDMSTIDNIIMGLEFQCNKRQERPKDCYDLLQSGMNKSGVYIIWPKSHFSQRKPLSVYCDMETDGGGWTVIQRRGQFSTPKDYFYKDWDTYKTGFGNIREEFWIGNDNIYDITNQRNYVIRFDLTDHKGNKAHAQYYTFWIEDEERGYKLHVDSHSGTAGDSMDHQHKEQRFSTKDRDNDLVNGGSCAHIHHGAWWYRDCYSSSLNGLNQPGTDAFVGILWFNWRKTVSLSGSEMKLRPR